MTVELHTLTKNSGKVKRKRRLGRGNSSGRGNYSGRGMKGQRSRSGGSKNLKRIGLRSLMKNTPKLGGFKSLRPKLESVNIGELEKHFTAGSKVNASTLTAKKLIRSGRNGVKVLGQGKLTKSLIVVADSFSQTAHDAITKAGGKIITRKKPK